MHAACSLGKIGDRKTALPPLQRALQDKKDQVRKAAVEALAQLRAAEAKAWLRPLLHDENPAVAEAASTALKALDTIK